MPKHSLRISGSPNVEIATGKPASKRWMDLLQSIGTTRSIAAAAKAVGLSYKAAWDAIDAMNNLSEKPLVERTKGGKGGGGTILTERGRQIVATYQTLQQENERFVATLNARIKHADRDLKVIERMTLRTSARNHFSGKIRRLKKGAVNDELELALSGGESVIAIVTHESVEQLGLEVGVEAIALIKASSVMVAVGEASQILLSARNQLTGVIKRLVKGAVNTEVVIELKGGNSVAAIITNASAAKLKLAEGKAATAIFKASSVIVGVTA
ncbi:MAG TPA: TOBE domain-containing protein [Steroidobacteraceae bacterium]|nr:TOBE domain-containing protein [Steroidobacteraceae bacterium]